MPTKYFTRKGEPRRYVLPGRETTLESMDAKPTGSLQQPAFTDAFLLSSICLQVLYSCTQKNLEDL